MSNASEEREFVKCLATNPDYSRLSVERALRVVQRENLAPDHVVQDLRRVMQEVRVIVVRKTIIAVRKTLRGSVV